MLRAGLVGVFLLAAYGNSAPLRRISVTCAGSICTPEADWTAPQWVARGAFRPSQNETGWATLYVESARGAEDREAAFAAGYVEGFLTAELMWDSWTSMRDSNRVPNAKVQAFVRKQVDFLNAKVAAAPHGPVDEREYWQSVGTVLQQVEGLAAGYESARQRGRSDLPPLSLEQIPWVGMNMELRDFLNAISPESRVDWGSLPDADFKRLVTGTGHCSALFRVTPDLSDLIAAHTTWNLYLWMLRIFKVYKLPFSTSKSDTVMFSGYPAAIASLDDFFINSQKLVVIETTNQIYNSSLWNYVTHTTVPYYIRVSVATRNAVSGKQWHDLFYKYNSGTYNSQWMVADYKLFTPGAPLPPWTFSVSEQVPGPFFHPGEDLTQILQRGHWPSYNRAYFKDVYEISGYPEMVQKQGWEASYQLAPRASIFRRDAEGVLVLDDMKTFIRSNTWGSDDPLATDSCSAIAGRSDLLLQGPWAEGAIDAKIVNKELMDSISVAAIAGPTTQGQPAFSFTGMWADVPHQGMPIVFDFEWQTFTLSNMGAQGPEELKVV